MVEVELELELISVKTPLREMCLGGMQIMRSECE